MDLQHEMSVAARAAREAGALAMQGWRTGAGVALKGAIDLVTQYDLECEELINSEINGAFPDDLVVGEEASTDDRAAQESDARNTAENTQPSRVWYVDPIDGTTNFAHGHPFFCVSIAMYEDDAAQVGVVAAPALGITWSAVRGEGAMRNGEPCRVSDRAELSQALCATGFPYDRWANPNNNTQEFKQFLSATRGIRRCGSAAIDLAMIAEGTYDIYWERGLNAWDMCAGALLVSEAGGTLSSYGGAPAEPRLGELVATNGKLHREALRLLQLAGAPSA